jgi:hypothetical protein
MLPRWFVVPARFVVLALAAAAAACSGAGNAFNGVFSCNGTVETVDGGFMPKTCVEGTGGKNSDVPGYRAKCHSPAFFDYTRCTRLNLAGGCRAREGDATLVTFYYAEDGVTTDVVREICKASDADFLAP